LHSDGSVAYTYTLTHNDDRSALVEQTIAHRKLDKKTDLNNETGNFPELVTCRARECAACLHVADALNAGVVNTYSLVERDFDWLQFKVDIFDFFIPGACVPFLPSFFRAHPPTFRVEYARTMPWLSAIR